MRSILRTLRWLVVLTLWTLALVLGTLGLGMLARIFTGDVSYGALDGFQFTDALYGAVIRFVGAGILGWLAWRLLRGSAGGEHPAEQDPRRCDDERPVVGDEVVEPT